eukprot:1156383-Pelagomonas_calceolata.AAC.4
MLPVVLAPAAADIALPACPEQHWSSSAQIELQLVVVHIGNKEYDKGNILSDNCNGSAQFERNWLEEGTKMAAPVCRADWDFGLMLMMVSKYEGRGSQGGCAACLTHHLGAFGLQEVDFVIRRVRPVLKKSLHLLQGPLPAQIGAPVLGSSFLACRTIPSALPAVGQLTWWERWLKI